MPLYEFECKDCMKKYNKYITDLSKSLDKKTGEKVMERNKNFLYIEVQKIKTEKTVFSLGKEGNKGIKRYRYRMGKDKYLFLELRDFRFTELFFQDEEVPKSVECPCDKKCKDVVRIFSPFKAIFEKRGGLKDRAPKPGDPVQWHKDYKVMKDEEQASNWVGQDHLDQYFGNSQHDGSYGSE